MLKGFLKNLATATLLCSFVGHVNADEGKGPYYPIKYFDVVRLKAATPSGEYYLASFPETYKYGPDRLTGPCKGNMDQMHVVVLTANNKLGNNALWRVLPSHGASVASVTNQGNAGLPYGAKIRLQNLATERNLHAQGCPSINSPLDMQVSTCIRDGGGDVNADWDIILDATEKSINGGMRSVEVGFNFKLRHATTAWILHAQGGKPPLARDWLEVSAFVPSSDPTERVKYSQWRFEKDVTSNSANDLAMAQTCYTRDVVSLSKKINDFLDALASNYDEAHRIVSRKDRSILNSIVSRAVLDKLVFDQDKWNDKLKDSCVDFLKDSLIAGLLYRSSKDRPEFKAALVGAGAALTAKFAIETYLATRMDETQAITIKEFLDADRTRVINLIQVLKSQAQEKDLFSAQALCIELEREKLSAPDQVLLLNSKIDLLRKINR